MNSPEVTTGVVTITHDSLAISSIPQDEVVRRLDELLFFPFIHFCRSFIDVSLYTIYVLFPPIYSIY